MAQDRILHLRRKVKAAPLPSVIGYYPDALLIMGKMPRVFIDRPLTGMPERRMSQVMPQGRGFDHVFVKAQRPADRTGNLGDLHTVGQAGTVMVAGRQIYLGFML